MNLMGACVVVNIECQQTPSEEGGLRFRCSKYGRTCKTEGGQHSDVGGVRICLTPNRHCTHWNGDIVTVEEFRKKTSER
jgi:hypothetical protein